MELLKVVRSDFKTSSFFFIISNLREKHSYLINYEIIAFTVSAVVDTLIERYNTHTHAYLKSVITEGFFGTELQR